MEGKNIKNWKSKTDKKENIDRRRGREARNTES